MIVYIHRRAKFFCLDPGQEELKPPMFGIGYTLQDYFTGKFVKLTKEQTAYWQANPDCHPIEVFNMKRFEESGLEIPDQAEFEEYDEYSVSGSNDF